MLGGIVLFHDDVGIMNYGRVLEDVDAAIHVPRRLVAHELPVEVDQEVPYRVSVTHSTWTVKPSTSASRMVTVPSADAREGARSGRNTAPGIRTLESLMTFIT